MCSSFMETDMKPTSICHPQQFAYMKDKDINKDCNNDQQRFFSSNLINVLQAMLQISYNESDNLLVRYNLFIFYYCSLYHYCLVHKHLIEVFPVSTAV